MTPAHKALNALLEETENQQPWTEARAQDLAQERGIGTLTDAHWRFIRALRHHFIQYGGIPPMQVACGASRLEPQCVNALFHSEQEALQIAGLPDPANSPQDEFYN